MTVADWQAIITLILGIAAVAGIIFTVLRFYIRAFAKQELDEIKHELKPNSGTSIKDQITRLEENHKRIEAENRSINKKLDKLDDRVETIFEVILKHFGN